LIILGDGGTGPAEERINSGDAEGGEAGSRAGTGSREGTTPVCGRPRPNFPVKRFEFGDERRPPRIPPMEPCPVPDWSNAIFEEARMIASFNREEIKGMYDRFQMFDTTGHGFITGEA